MSYTPDCDDCPTPAECKAANDCKVMREIRHPADPDRAEFLREAHLQLYKVLTKGDIEAVRWMVQTAIDYHDTNESGADAMDMIESAEYHRKRREELSAMMPSATRESIIEECANVAQHCYSVGNNVAVCDGVAKAIRALKEVK